ncbi:MAG: cellulase family glycosylhydrolase [Pseudomonadota bacterium]
MFKRLLGLLLLVFAFGTSDASADVWSTNAVPAKLASGLSQVGLNSNATWTSCRQRTDSDAVVSKVLNDGWKHYVYVVCIDDVLNIQKDFAYDSRRLKQRMKTIGDQVRRLSGKHPNATFVVSMKGRLPVGGWDYYDANGLRATIVYQAYETRADVRESYQKMWQDAASALRDIGSDTLAFNLMNEPEYHNRGRKALSEWKTNTVGIIDAIRSVSPDRVIIVEGIFKSLVGRKLAPNKLVAKLPRTGIVYAFHYYEPDKFTHKRDSGGTTFTNGIAREVTKDMRSVVRFSKSKSLPVVVSEFGVWGPYISGGALKSGVSATDRAAYAKTVYDATVPSGIGITWWALGDDNTPYQRLRFSKKDKSQPRLVRDDLLFQALGLN